MIKRYRILVVSTPIGTLGSGEGGGVELTLVSIVAVLLLRGHELTILAKKGSSLPVDCQAATLKTFDGENQCSWQNGTRTELIQIPDNGLLPKFWGWVLQEQEKFDLILNLSYDWLPFWITPYVSTPIFHLVSMGSVSESMDRVINNVACWDQRRLAFHTRTQACDFALPQAPIIVGSGFDIDTYHFSLSPESHFGWVGRITPEKGLEDAAIVASRLGVKLKVWGLKENTSYANKVENSVPPGIISWEGFLPGTKLQKVLSSCQCLLNTPKWNEAFGNVTVEAMACGVPVLAYNRGGPGELVKSGINGWLVPPDDIMALTEVAYRIKDINRLRTRQWAKDNFSRSAFALRLETWFTAGLK
uniref:Putative UDP-glucose:tetrahydrobiopterin glucosyltransferase n=1 Tax=Paulinella micropora TaxID=1928728 RepID=A0A385I187_9EUKA|nr:putative UDP-glucose:tetrahydrobiopterin glucosyltransferase [Paulinella micropora]AXY63644.1 putative UDP-glucose:tetrahydrobiopterin glucosyltransferase [Paulinella micropora]